MLLITSLVMPSTILIRVPAAFAESMYKGPEHWLEKETEDENITVHIGRRRTKKNAQLQNYHCLPKSRRYDFIEPGSDNTDALQLRVLKFPIGEDSYEYIVTDLPQYAFPLQTIKELYNLRWNHLCEPCSYTNFRGRNPVNTDIPASRSSYKTLIESKHPCYFVLVIWS